MGYNPVYHTPRWEKMRKAILYRDGYQCRQCRRFGKNTAANTVHHIVPQNMNLFYIPHNLISLCDNCHNMMHDRNSDILTGLGEEWKSRLKRDHPDLVKDDNEFRYRVVVVSGCIGSGKTKYVRENKKTYDIVFDYDAILNALLLNDTTIHYHDKPHIDIMLSLREHLYTLIKCKRGKWDTAWIITTSKGEKQRELITRFNAEHIEIDTSKDECINNIMRDDTRPDKEKEIELIEKYFS